MAIETLVAGLLTAAIFSFLYRENPFYRAAEYLLVGISIGYVLVILIDETILSKVVKPLFGAGHLSALIPALLGVLMFSQLFRRFGFLARIPLAVLIGAGAGVSIPALIGARILKQMAACLLPIYTVSGAVILIGVLATLAYFYFSREQTGVMGGIAKLGTYFLMVFFGATFGYTVMSRVTLLIGRLEFLAGILPGIVR